jgi:hypothetical protein
LGNLLDTMGNSNLKKFLYMLLEILLVLELFWDFAFIEIFIFCM